MTHFNAVLMILHLWRHLFVQWRHIPKHPLVKITPSGRNWLRKMEFLTVYFMKIIFQVSLLWIEHKVYIVNLSLRASDDVIMPFWSERVIVLTLLCLEVRGGTVRRLKEREKKENRSLPVYPRENTNKYYDSGTVKCVRLTLVVTPG